MQIVFDMAYDQQVAPNGVQAGQSSMGKVFVGSQGLLNVLETHLGLTAKETHHAMRIQGYMEGMQAVLHMPEATFFKQSFEADAWSSAKQFLDWRDELILAGWDGCDFSSSSSRLKALVLVEKVFANSLKRGLGDRLQVLLTALKQVDTLQIKSISLSMAIDDLPYLISQVLLQTSRLGVNIEQLASTAVLATGNLGSIQQAVLDSDAPREHLVNGDDSIVLLRPEDEWTAANTLAAWLKADEKGNAEVLLIQGDGSDVLDHALSQVGLPMLGNHQRSAFRAALQIMPLALANAWNPLNIQALLSFLALPVSPVPRFAAKRLMSAIQSEPGIGGERWQQAEQKIIQIKKARLIEDGLNESQAETEAKTFMDELNYFLTSFRFDAREGIPPQKLIEICQWIKKGMKSPALKQSMAQALAQVDRMVELAESYNTPISKAQIERMLDSVIAEGGQNPDSHAQATPWHTVADVGAIAAPVETIIWWGFNDSNQSSITFWSEAERDALKQSNVHLENTAVVRARESRQWQQAITCAGKQLILIAPKKDKGELTQLHPLWDEIRYYATSSVEVSKLKEEVCSYLEWSGANFNAQAHFELAGRKVFLSNEDKAYLKSSEIMLSVEKDTIKKPDNLSFSQMSTLLACPTKWAFQYHAKLSSMDSLSLPTGNTMIGSLCHKIVEDIYTDESQWSVSTVREYTSELFDMRVPQMAAELLEPGRELERERYRISVCDAVDALLKTIAQADLKVIKTEGKVDGKDLDGIPFRGYIDLLLEDNDGQVFVIDLKWSGSVRYKKNEVEEGKALQLASYAWMLRENDESWAPGAYFMLAQGELLTDDYRFKTVDVIESPLAAKDVWALGSKTWHNMFYQAIAGDIEVSGLLDEKELKAHREGQGLMYINPPCHFCEFGKLCGKTRAIA